jgi:23S rRNA (cytidine2498-2'-O)-methyltransferase
MNPTTISLAIYELEAELERELTFRNITFEKHDRLYFFNKNYQPLFAQVSWLNCQTLPITSIGDGIKKLRALGKNWALFSIDNHRRAQLIQEGLAKIKDAPVPFLAEQPKHSMGGWTLLDQNTIICSPQTTSRYPLGAIEFVENKKIPPSRAYLKLWEFFTVHCPPPPAKTTVIDLGSSPGGWSWVLSQLNLDVISVDKAPLTNAIAQIPNITFLQESAFGLDPKKLLGVEWLFSDIICYPERLLSLIKKWQQEGSVQNFVCTIKFQGEADFTVIDEFLKIPNSHMVHLYHNKHEVMWWKTKNNQ